MSIFEWVMVVLAIFAVLQIMLAAKGIEDVHYMLARIDERLSHIQADVQGLA